ncbi:MAG: hypothetical protein ACYTG7_05825 [Planctomycetota bacterium]|jgi:hypothetical protein
MNRTWICAALLLALLLTSTGCLLVAKAYKIPDCVECTGATLGRELLDLREAHEDGVITASEYERAKAAMLRKYEEAD